MKGLTYFTELGQQRVIVTGGSKGIGREIAMAFARLGAVVTISGRNEQDLLRTADELQVFHPGCSYIVSDIRQAASCHALIDEAFARMGGVDVLVNNAGINIAKPSLDVTEHDWDQVVDTNLKGMFFCSQQAGKYMIRQREGTIVNIVSQMAFVGFYDRAAYCSSKGGAVQLTKALAVEWAEHQVRVNAVAPTFIETEMTSGMLGNPAFKQEVLSRIPLGATPAPSDIASAVVFLASDMARFVTGETLRVDGGWTAI
ncbi:SDR family NAD(P)-dependent oxidoreductase [Paenibacillus cymbidii]|uniref:SDR family NAD(P)-dependent oxidoreductase n=1 Tax=Paenibacillus cymbidii TaxID=1639034 RepID=UPI001F34A674|nr:SDR family NAD(P)-dependent oxidoreductase [Paenibacillus cymbidii]